MNADLDSAITIAFEEDVDRIVYNSGLYHYHYTPTQENTEGERTSYNAEILFWTKFNNDLITITTMYIFVFKNIFESLLKD